MAVAVVCLTLLLYFVLSSSQGSLVLPALGSGLVALWLMVHPHWGVLAILAAWFAEIDPITVRFITFTQMIVVVLALPLALAILRDRSMWVWRFATRFGFLILFLYFIRTPRQILMATLLLTILVLVAASDGLVIFVSEGATRRLRSLLIPGTGNPNRMALAAIFGLGLVWFFRLYAPFTRWRMLTLPALLALPVTTLLTASRGGFVQLMIFSALALREHRGLTAARKLQGLVLIGVVVALLSIIVPTTTYLRATTFEATAQAAGGTSLQNRITTIKAAVEMTLENPLLGVGPGNFRWRHQVLYGDEQPSHNSYLWALTSGGPLLLILYLALFRRIHRRLAAVERWGPPELSWLGKALRINLIMFMIATLFADYWLSIYPYVFVGIGVAISRLSPGTHTVGRTAPRIAASWRSAQTI
jgi:hypothetical protein